MIYGIGTDICDIRRIQASLTRHGERFAEKILGVAELATWHARSQSHNGRGLRYLATRFSSKEAFSKAIGLGMVWPMTWQHCEIITSSTGTPTTLLHGALKDWFEARALRCHISLSDEADYAVSFCVVEQER